MSKMISILFLVIALLAVNASAVVSNYTFDTSEKDESVYNKNAIVILRAFDEIPVGSELTINDELMNRDEFMQSVFYPNHPVAWMETGWKVEDGDTKPEDASSMHMPIDPLVIICIIGFGMIAYKMRDGEK